MLSPQTVSNFTILLCWQAMMLISIGALFVRIKKEKPFRQAADICDGNLMPQGFPFCFM
jgi:hypothetical protein